MRIPDLRRLLPARPVLFVFLALSLTSMPLDASRVRPVNVEEMTDRADRIFSARCVDVDVRQDPDLGLAVTWVTLEVDRAVKGDLGRTVTLKLLHGPAAARFQPGEEVILFLHGESSLGLTSPVGLGQGRFRILEDKHGRRIAVNGLANRGLFRGLSAGAERRLEGGHARWRDRGIPAEALLGLVESLGRGAPAAPGPEEPR